ncbi:hypothetical protein Bca52824_025678 [Brassica carinata]|uniref:O-fucosyltransferase family protein n=1 Tax=Brassica carinata TaxID=52824 RepID=A0A8X7SG20_BRACI|nr:hypothetical protein Bca52824_025678 [Brassica carinata]
MVSVPVKPLFVVVLTFAPPRRDPAISVASVRAHSALFCSFAKIFNLNLSFASVILRYGVSRALPADTNGYIRIDCFGGLNQMRRDLCDGVGIARLLNATLVLPRFEVAAYWNESSGFGDVFDVDYFIQKMNGFVNVVKDLPTDISPKEPFRVDCSKRKGQFDYRESILPLLLEHHYISLTPAMSQRRDRYPQYAKATLCQACYSALRLTSSLEKKAVELLDAIPKPFFAAIKAAGGDKTVDRRDSSELEKARKVPLTPNETALMLQSLRIPTSTNIYLAAGDGLMEMEGFTSVYTKVFTNDAYVATYFGNMDKMVAAMRAYKGMHKTLFLSRKAFAELTSQGLEEEELKKALWEVHKSDFESGRGSALPDCFCEFKL